MPDLLQLKDLAQVRPDRVTTQGAIPQICALWRYRMHLTEACSAALAALLASASFFAAMERRIVDLFNKYKGICASHFGRPVSDNCTFDPQIET